MNIFRVADEKNIPDWIMGNQPQNDNSPIEEVESVNIATDVTDEILAQECDRIEACVANGKIYHYNSTWKSDAIKHLHEYATVCGMDKGCFRGFDPSDVKVISKANGVTKTAHVAQESRSRLQETLGDPFHIEEHSDMSHMKVANWQQVTKQINLDDSGLNNGNVIALRGGEDYFLNSDVNPAINQNSITNPDAIRQLAESTQIDNGQRLRQQQEEKKQNKIAENKEWEQNKIAEMAHNDIVSKGVVFQTATFDANNGLNNPSSQMGVYAKFSPDDIPTKTAGEQLSDKNKQHKESIQRPKTQDDWQKPCKQSSRTISDLFGDELQKILAVK
jgi:hypothetical protein